MSVDPAASGVTLLAGGDFHLGPLCHEFESRLGEDVVPIFLGDLVNRPRRDAPAFFSLVRRWERLNPDLVVVPGNHDPEPAGRWEGTQIHERRGLRILAIPVIPILYKIPSWTHEYSERRIAEMLDPYRGERFDLIASHAPPHGTVDRLAWGRHLGSRALRTFGDDVTFGMWIAAHVHDQRGSRGDIAGRPVLNTARMLSRLSLVPGGPAAS